MASESVAYSAFSLMDPSDPIQAQVIIIIPLTLMASESVAYSAFNLMDY